MRGVSRYDEFSELIETALVYSIGEMVKEKNIINPAGQLKSRMDEDQLTLMLSKPLKGMGFDIAHSKNVGGNCDISIEGDSEMLWLGEAKIYSDYGKLMGGHQQLVDRYAPGMAAQLNSGMIIYMFGEKAASMMGEWRKYLKDTREGLKSEDVEGQALHFRTIEPHRGTEQSLSVRHFVVPLHHEPTDPKPPPPRLKAA